MFQRNNSHELFLTTSKAKKVEEINTDLAVLQKTFFRCEVICSTVASFLKPP
jgi:hypothetical protein